ncbi:MAG: hypothetical protein ACE14S_12115 [Candidatus Bathyarchaeia archaeon]
MPSIIPSYIYTLFASIMVGTIVISVCGLSVSGVKHEAEKQHLSRLAEYVAMECTELTSQAPSGNQTFTLYLDLPDLVGNQRFWMRAENDSSRAWIEAGFGAVLLSSGLRVYVPVDGAFSGSFVSGSGVVFVSCQSDASGLHITLSGGD